jgi:hypothetical protein
MLQGAAQPCAIQRDAGTDPVRPGTDPGTNATPAAERWVPRIQVLIKESETASMDSDFENKPGPFGSPCLPSRSYGAANWAAAGAEPILPSSRWTISSASVSASAR